jgi:hypothetical protein
MIEYLQSWYKLFSSIKNQAYENSKNDFTGCGPFY